MKKAIKESTNEAISCQEPILRHLQVGDVPVNIYLKTGIKIQGFIAAFDSQVIILQSANIHQMIFKHTISTVEPQMG